MEEGSFSASASSLPPDSTPLMASGSASKFLANLPSRGLFSATVSSSNLACIWDLPAPQKGQQFEAHSGGMRVYVCDHDTAPPENQVIKTDQMNILIRSLTLKKLKGDVADGSRKRVSDRTGDGRASTKRAMTNTPNGVQQGGSSNRMTEMNFQGLTVERLRALLKEKGLSPKGRKDELIARLRNASK